MMQFSMQLRYWHLEDWPSPYGARDEICYKGQQPLVVIAASYKGCLFFILETMASFSLLKIMEVAFISDSLCQGSYEAAVESGVKNQAACKRTKQILQIRKQDSYTKAIGGSFEDDHGSEGKGGGGGGEPAVKMRKQESYLMAVGELVSSFSLLE